MPTGQNVPHAYFPLTLTSGTSLHRKKDNGQQQHWFPVPLVKTDLAGQMNEPSWITEPHEEDLLLGLHELLFSSWQSTSSS